MSYAPVAFPPPPPTSNALSSHERAAFVRSSKKLSKVLGDVPHVLDNDIPSPTHNVTATDTESTWRKRKPTHLPPLLKLSPSVSNITDPDSPVSLTYQRRGSVLSVAPSIISNAPSTASSASDAPSDSTQRRTKLERLRRKLGDEVPATAVFPTAPRTAVPRTPRTATSTTMPKRSPHGRACPVARLPAHVQPDDTRSLTFSISSDESVHRVTLSARVHSPHPTRTRQKHIYQTGALPPVPPVPTHLASSSSPSSATPCDDGAGLVRPRQKLAAGSKIGGSDFKAARRAKREGRLAEPGEMIEMVGFLW